MKWSWKHIRPICKVSKCIFCCSQAMLLVSKHQVACRRAGKGRYLRLLAFAKQLEQQTWGSVSGTAMPTPLPFKKLVWRNWNNWDMLQITFLGFWGPKDKEQRCHWLSDDYPIIPRSARKVLSNILCTLCSVPKHPLDLTCSSIQPCHSCSADGTASWNGIPVTLAAN